MTHPSLLTKRSQNITSRLSSKTCTFQASDVTLSGDTHIWTPTQVSSFEQPHCRKTSRRDQPSFAICACIPCTFFGMLPCDHQVSNLVRTQYLSFLTSSLPEPNLPARTYPGLCANLSMLSLCFLKSRNPRHMHH